MLAVEVKNLTKTFNQTTAIDSINLDIEKGKIIGLIGPDGAGKTTLLRLFMGLLNPSSGSILINGLDTSKNQQAVKKLAGYMPQHFSLYGDLRVSENLKFFADLQGFSKNKFPERKKELLRFSGLAPFEKRLARNLSGGMQKKLALACNLFHTPEILLLDEPTTGVDPVSRRELWDILFQLNRQGVTLIITTPYMDEAQRCHQAGLIYEGKILRFQSPENIIKEMKDEILELVTDHEETRRILKKFPGLKSIYPYGGTLHLTFETGKIWIEKTRDFLEAHAIKPKNLKRITPSLEDAFLYLINKQSSQIK